MKKLLNAEKAMTRLKAFRTNKNLIASYDPWLSPETMDDLIQACPFSVLEIACTKAQVEGKDLKFDDLGLGIYEKEGLVNVEALTQAIEDLEFVTDISFLERATIRAELIGVFNRLDLGMAKEPEKHNFLQEYLDSRSVMTLSANLRDNGVPEILPPGKSPGYDWRGDQQDFDPNYDKPSKDRKKILPSAEGGEKLYTEDGTDFDPQSWGYGKAGNPGYDDDGNFIGPGDVGLQASISSPEFRSMPNFKILGIDRIAGSASEDELKAFKGATKPDGTTPSTEDYYSVGVLLANNDYMPDRGQVIPGVELARLGRILEYRSKGSDEDHSRMARTGHFILVNPKIGFDPNVALHKDNPLRGKEPYTALTARAIFPKTSLSPDHESILERVRRGLLRNVSITPQVQGITCSGCGEMPVHELVRMGDYVTGLRFHPDWMAESLSPSDLMSMVGSPLILRHLDPHYTNPSPAVRDGQPNGVWDTKANKGPYSDVKDGQPDGLLYSDLMVTGVDNSGCLSLSPVMFPTRDPVKDGIGMVAMTKVRPVPMYADGLKAKTRIILGGERIELSSPDEERFCPIHGLVGSVHPSGKKIVGLWAGISQLFNVAAVDAGAINDARFVLDPEINY